MAKPTHAAIVLAATLLGGCQTTFDLVGVVTPLSAGEARRWNGSYQGSIRQADTNGPACPTERGERVLMVGDDVIWYAYTPQTFFAAPIRYDGTVDNLSGTTTMKGDIVGDRMRLTVKSPDCETRFDMSYIYNH